MGVMEESSRPPPLPNEELEHKAKDEVDAEEKAALAKGMEEGRPEQAGARANVEEEAFAKKQEAEAKAKAEKEAKAKRDEEARIKAELETLAKAAQEEARVR